MKAIEINNETIQATDTQPSNIDAEKAVLGAFLNNNENLNKVADFLLPEHFYVPLHRKVYEIILNFVEKGLLATPITMKSYFDSDEALQKAGASSIEYLTKLSANAAGITNLVPYAKEIYDTSLKRSLIKVSEETISDVFSNKVAVFANDILEETEHKLFNLAISGNADKKVYSLKDSVLSALTRIDNARKIGAEISGTTTGYLDLDKMLAGLQNSDLLILAARPSMGKTSLAINIALNAAISFMDNKAVDKKQSVAVFSLEMSAEQIANRLLSVKTGVDGSKIRIGNISKAEFESLLRESSVLNEMPMFIDDTPALTISALRTRARRLKRQQNIGLIIVDYLQLLRGSSINEGNRVQEIGEISQGLKAIAKELNVPVIALSQLSRAVESRDDKRPQLSDLRESGSIEQDADVVMFIYREEYYLSRKMPAIGTEEYIKWQQDMESARSIAEVIIAKQRNGPIGTVNLRFDNNTTEFTNLEREHHSPMTIMSS